MNSEKRDKLNKLLKAWVPGTVVTASWLESQEIYQQLAHKYERSCWIERIGHGAFIKAGDKVTWEGAVYSIQNQLGLPVHVAAKTALEIQGFAHFLPIGRKHRVILFGEPQTKLPAWFKNAKWGSAVINFQTSGLFSKDITLGLTEKNVGTFSINVSSPERAVLELLALVPQSEDFEEASLIMEGLANLRPKVVQGLLEKCNSIKAKRLFLFLAERQGHAWFRRVNLLKVKIGKGKRQIVSRGYFDKKYLISVPKGFAPKPSDDG